MPGLVPSWSVAVVLLVTLLLANLPFVGPYFCAGSESLIKSVGWRLIELLAFTALTRLSWDGPSEGKLTSVRSVPLRWEFVAVWVVSFATFAFPGFVWRYLRRH